ncbi:MAG: DNA polymerase III subunit delta [Cocleimonas sp.]
MMRLNFEQLPNYLEKQQSMPLVFLISGNEPLQKMEAADCIRQYAKKRHFNEREVLHADAQFKWGSLTGSSNALSLFSEKKIIDLRVETKTPGKVGGQTIKEYMQNPPEDKVLLIQTAKLPASTMKSAWVKSIENVGVVIQIWDLSTPQTMTWVRNRLQREGMKPTTEAVRLLTERVEGNLLAAAQEISKLKLLFCEKDAHETPIDEEKVLMSVSDSSRFSIFDLSNAVMLGDTRRVQHIHHNLKEEGVPIQLVLWTLSDLSRQLYNADFSLNNGMQVSQVLSKLPRPRQQPFQKALQRMKGADWMSILKKNVEIDRLSKGQSESVNKGLGRVWSELLELALILAGKRVIEI